LRIGGDQAWRCRSRLLEAQSVRARGDAARAYRLLSAPLPNRPELAGLEAYRLMLQGESLLKLDNYESAGSALEEARQRADLLPCRTCWLKSMSCAGFC
jgi:hypothetical protein